jgi:hypothetical protein
MDSWPGIPTRRFHPQESLLLTFSMGPLAQAFGSKRWWRISPFSAVTIKK